MKLDGKVAVVTGAASGIGRAIAIRYTQEGAKVVVSDLNIEGAKETVSIIEGKVGTAIAVRTDVSKEEDIQKMIDTAVNTYGTIDILVNNAGIMDNFVPAAEITDELWERVFAVNTISVMRATRKTLPIFLAKGKGIIINVASIGGFRGSVAGATYTASKHAVIGFTKNVGFQYAKLGIRCNAIAPGPVLTNISIPNPDQFGLERATCGAATSPRPGQPEEIAGAALFLASDDASFVNGAVLTVDGGWSAY